MPPNATDEPPAHADLAAPAPVRRPYRRDPAQGRRTPMIRQTPSGRWQARYRDSTGTQRAKNFATKAEARRFIERIHTELARGEWIDPGAGKVTFAEWAEEWSAGLVNLRLNTLVQQRGILRRDLLPRFGPRPLGRITPVEVQRFIADAMAEGRLSAATVRKLGQVLIKVLKDAEAARLIPRSPAAGLALPPVPEFCARFLDAAEVDRLVQALPLFYRPLVLTAAYTGLRWGELAGLRPQRVDLARARLEVVEQLTEVGAVLDFGPPKTKAGRRAVGLPSFLVEMLDEHLRRPQVADAGLVFPDEAARPLRRSHFWHRPWGPAVVEADLVGVRFHDLRHTCVALLIASGAHPKAVQTQLGHASITVTLDRYGHLFPSFESELAAGLDAVYRRPR
jgi:integrase